MEEVMMDNTDTDTTPGLHDSENGPMFGPCSSENLHGVCVSSKLPYCQPTSGSESLRGTSCGEEEQYSPGSEDSGIPTLELSASEDAPHLHITAEARAPTHRDAPATLKLETTGGGGASSHRDSTSVCSTSSLSTELSTTLSLGNDDHADFVVTSNSSAVVDFQDFVESPKFSKAPPINDGAFDHLQHPPQRQSEVTPRRASPIADFFNSVFSKKIRDADGQEPHAETSWNIFSRASRRDTKRAVKENEKAGGSASPRQRSLRRNLEFEPLSTTALILEHRPANLPAKPEEEAQKHQQQYEEMVAQARKRELKEAQRKRKQLEERARLEESIGNAALTWSQEILPDWNSMHCTRRVRDLWWQGIPPSVRGRVWSLAIGNDLNITLELYDICLARAKEKWSTYPSVTTTDSNAGDTGSSCADREASLELIKLDISRTFPNLCIFQQGGPYHDVLHSVLGAYTCYRPDVGYVQGMSFIAAVLLLNMNTSDAFIAFTNLLNKPCQMAFYRVDHSLMLTYFAAFEVFFEENMPKLFAHFKSNNLTPDIYLIDWIFTLYSKSLPLDVACRVWDVFCRDGEEFLFRTALGILRFYCDVLMKMDFIHMAQFLTRLPEQNSSHAQSHTLFSCIGSMSMTCRNRTWTQVLQTLQKEPEHSSPVLNLKH
ncbi:TBC1 domain family member 14-like [Trichomycterus rosablanca]|uniref:TBC1 domain family member 14-like n=1 Tax=Trichomycterus rosablanca TaxID=2290929 RepID=UPI002F35ADDA